MTEPKTSRGLRPTRRSDRRTLGRFIEELSWVLSSFEDLDFKALASLASLASEKSAGQSMSNAKSRSTETYTFLGRLPALFMDDKLFAGNEDIVEFAEHALHISIPRWHKKSKYELIGHVVCNANLLTNERLRQLSLAIEKIQDAKSKEHELIQTQRRSGLSWNEVIQNMLEAT